jgi:hypothetical protein
MDSQFSSIIEEDYMSMTPEQRRRFVDRALSHDPKLLHSIGQSPEQLIAEKLQQVDRDVLKIIGPEVQFRGYITDEIKGRCSALYLERLSSALSREERDAILSTYMSIALLDRLR